MSNVLTEGLPSDLAEIIAIHQGLFKGWRMVETDDDDAGAADEKGKKKPEPNWKAQSRSNERKLRAALKKIEAAEAASGTPDERLSKETERADRAEARANRREVALGYKLSSEDAELLDDITDEDAMHRIAKRLQVTAKRKKVADEDDEDDEDEDETPRPRVRRGKPRDGIGGSSEDAVNRRTARAVFGGGQ